MSAVIFIHGEQLALLYIVFLLICTVGVVYGIYAGVKLWKNRRR